MVVIQSKRPFLEVFLMEHQQNNVDDDKKGSGDHKDGVRDETEGVGRGDVLFLEVGEQDIYCRVTEHENQIGTLEDHGKDVTHTHLDRFNCKTLCVFLIEDVTLDEGIDKD